MRNSVWAISNLCRNKNPPPDFNLVKPALPLLAQLLQHKDKDVLADTCWALSYLTDGSNEKIQAVIDTGLVPRLVQLLSSTELTVLTPALRAVGNIVTGSDNQVNIQYQLRPFVTILHSNCYKFQTDTVIHAGALDIIGVLLQHIRLNIVKEAAWAVSNITAGNSEQIQKVLDAGVMDPLLHVLQTVSTLHLGVYI